MADTDTNIYWHAPEATTTGEAVHAAHKDEQDTAHASAQVEDEVRETSSQTTVDDGSAHSKEASTSLVPTTKGALQPYAEDREAPTHEQKGRWLKWIGAGAAVAALSVGGLVVKSLNSSESESVSAGVPVTAPERSESTTTTSSAPATTQTTTPEISVSAENKPVPAAGTDPETVATALYTNLENAINTGDESLLRYYTQSNPNLPLYKEALEILNRRKANPSEKYHYDVFHIYEEESDLSDPFNGKIVLNLSVGEGNDSESRFMELKVVEGMLPNPENPTQLINAWVVADTSLRCDINPHMPEC